MPLPASDARRKTHIALIDQAFISAINFGTGLLLARFLGMEGYGEFVLAYGIIIFAAGMQMALVISPMMTIGPTQPDSDKAQYYRAIILQQLGFALFLTFLTLLSCWTLDKVAPQWRLDIIRWPLSFALITFLTQDFSRRLFFVRNEPFRAFMSDLISYGSQAAILIVYVINYKPTAPSALWIIGATSLLATIYAFGTYLADEPWTAPARNQIKDYISAHWQIGKWLMGQTIVYWAGPQFILYLAAIVLSVSAVGAMAAARNVVGFVNILFSALENLVPSRAAQTLQRGGKTELSRYLKRISIIGGSITLAIASVASTAPELWLNLLYGDEYAGYGWIVIAWSIYFVIGFFHRPYNAVLRALNQTKSIFSSHLAGTVFVLGASYLSITLAGILGVMFTLCINQVIILGLMGWHYTTYENIRPIT